MKRYKVNKALFLILPVFILCIIGSYMLVLFKKSYTYINVINISLDIIILFYYVKGFCHEVGIDSQGINFYTLFKKYRFRYDEIISVASASFLTRITTQNKRLYILTTSKGQKILKDMLKVTMGSSEKR